MRVQTSLQAVSNPDRREILRLVWDAEMSSREIASHFDVTWQAVSLNLRVLRDPALRERLGAEGRRRAAEVGTPARVGRELLDVFGRVGARP